jgi:hypothetical protein
MMPTGNLHPFPLGKLSVLFFCSVLFSYSSYPQTTLQLTDVRHVETAESYAAAIRMPIKCDESGNIYLRGFQAFDTGLAPIMRISAAGKKDVLFSAPTHGGFTPVEIFNFQPITGGELAMVVGAREKDMFLLRLGRDGSFQSKAKLEKPLLVYSMFVFPNGNLLLSGTTIEENNKSLIASYLYDAGGRFLRKLIFDEDVELNKKLVTAEEPGEQIAESAAKLSIESSTIGFSSPDGNSYLVRGVSKPLIYVLNSGGEIVRKFRIPSPLGGAQLESAFFVNERILALFVKRDKEGNLEKAISSLHNATDGTQLLAYSVPSEAGATLACATPNELTFLTSKNKGLRLTKVALK